ncbi:hypothetical protein FQN54_004818 [Arachnomyces sp. PD_36]|nr:hypothetical protein FQN54_004818 [Arachnomyces sp. PD_36]
MASDPPRIAINPTVSSKESDNTNNEKRDDAAGPSQPKLRWKRILGVKDTADSEGSDEEKDAEREKWTMGILNDRQTDEVPGTILLLSSNRNEPLGLKHQPERLSTSSFPGSRSSSRRRAPPTPQKKRTPDGQIVLDPQPDDSMNDPLNWPMWRRDLALLSLGFYCLMGGGMTTILAAGFNNVSETYGVSTQEVAFTTGLYMLGLGIGSVIMSPTAILYGKRPVYMLGAILFVLSGVWCALSPNYPSLVVARVFQGIAVSPVECLPSATIAEIYFLHERAYRVGIYTLLLLGGKNLVPLVSAVIIQNLGWRWVFWIVALIAGFCLVLLFFFVPETFWDRTPRPRVKRPGMHRSVSDLVTQRLRGRHSMASDREQPSRPTTGKRKESGLAANDEKPDIDHYDGEKAHGAGADAITEAAPAHASPATLAPPAPSHTHTHLQVPDATGTHTPDVEAARSMLSSRGTSVAQSHIYTSNLRAQPRVPFVQTLKLWNGRLASDRWHKVVVRPLILFAYPAVLWSAMVYALSVGWLIVLSESVAHVYQNEHTYNFSALGTGLVYLSPFVGGILGTAVAGKVSDIIVRFMARRNGGVYEPEYRLVMAIPVALATAAGLMGFGWSAEEKDLWIVPTIFFGIVSFGCTMGSTTAITFCVDSYRQYAGEALVTLNFSKNVLHGLIFSLFFVNWLESSGMKNVFLAIGGIQLACLLATIPMYIYGKRARMWTVRMKLMEKF